MRITLEYRDPTPVHCNIVVFINGANAGTLTLRQEELLHFQMIIQNGCSKSLDVFLTKGNPAYKDLRDE